jgi:hypothetical protein
MSGNHFVSYTSILKGYLQPNELHVGYGTFIWTYSFQPGDTFVYVPKERTLRLIEIQESVLPEEEWLIGFSDLTYFSGVGFSMPIPFEPAYFEQNRDPLLGAHTGDVSIDFNQLQTDSIFAAEPESKSEESLLASGLEPSEISLGATSFLESEGLHPNGIDDDQLVATLADGIEKPTLYAFLPGLFYSAVHESSVDAVLIEVTKKCLHGQDITSFRPEDVRTFDVGTGLVLDENGSLEIVEMSMDVIGGFSADVTDAISGSVHSVRCQEEAALVDHLGRHLSHRLSSDSQA